MSVNIVTCSRCSAEINRKNDRYVQMKSGSFVCHACIQRQSGGDRELMIGADRAEAHKFNRNDPRESERI